MSLSQKAVSLFNRIVDIAFTLNCYILGFIIISVCIDVVLRYFFNDPLLWVLEYTEAALLYITFLGAALLQRKNRHIRMDMVLRNSSPKAQVVLNFTSTIIAAIIFSIITVYSAIVTFDFAQRGIYLITFLKTPRAPILAVIPIGSLLLVLQFIRDIIAYLRKMASHGTQ